MDYYLNIYKNGEYLFTVGGKNMDYDNIVWFEIKDVIDLAKVENLTKDQLIQLITTRSSYLVLCDTVKPEELGTDIDLETRQIVLDELVPLYNLDEEIGSIKVVEHNGKYFAQYEEGDEYPMNYVTFDDIDLLYKKSLSFDEFYKIFDFIEECIVVYDDTDFILNNKIVMRFNFA